MIFPPLIRPAVHPSLMEGRKLALAATIWIVFGLLAGLIFV